MSAIDIDFISPRNSASVTIAKANVIPSITNLTFHDTPSSTTATLTCQNVGHIYTICVPEITFTGTGAALQSGVITNLPAPSLTCRWQIVVDIPLLGPTIGMATITNSQHLTFYLDASGTVFATRAYIIRPCILQYYV